MAETGEIYLKRVGSYDAARSSVRVFNEAVEKMSHDRAVKSAIREGRYDQEAMELRRKQNLADMIMGLADLVRDSEAWLKTFTTEGPDGKPYLLRLKEF